MKTVAYYRTRPSEPAASAVALLAQQQAVRRAVEENGYTLVGEFIELEGIGHGWPAYCAAVRSAMAREG